MYVPVQRGCRAVDNLDAVHPYVAGVGFRMLRDYHWEREEWGGIGWPAFQRGEEREVRGIHADLLAGGCAAGAPRCDFRNPGQLRDDSQTLPYVCGLGGERVDESFYMSR